jgi:hypothetical protein
MSAATIDNLRITPRAMRAIDDAAARRAALAADAYDELLSEFFAGRCFTNSSVQPEPRWRRLQPG